jgi:hypothetical protein
MNSAKYKCHNLPARTTLTPYVLNINLNDKTAVTDKKRGFSLGLSRTARRHVRLDVKRFGYQQCVHVKGHIHILISSSPSQ